MLRASIKATASTATTACWPLRGVALEPSADNTLLLYDNPDMGVRFLHPRRRVTIETEAPLPADMERTLAALRKHRPPR